MSLELDWSLLDDQLAQGILNRLNKSLASASRPDFLGAIDLTSLDFGHDAPDVRLTQVGDVWRQFLDDSNVVKEGTTAVRTAATNTDDPRRPPPPPIHIYDDIDYDDVGLTTDSQPQVHTSKGAGAQRPSDHLARFAEDALPFTGQTTGIHAPRLQTFRQYTPSDIQQIHIGSGSVASFPATTALGTPFATGTGSGSRSTSGLGTPAWGPGIMSAGAGAHHPSTASGYFSPWQHGSHSLLNPQHQRPIPSRRTSSFAPTASRDTRSPSADFERRRDQEAGSSSSSIPSLQLQFSVLWSTNTFKLGINTSLLINHPTPAFMELPLSVSVIGLGVQAGCVVAFEDEGQGRGRKVHVSLVEAEEQEEEEEDEEEDAREKSSPSKTDDKPNLNPAASSSPSATAAGAAALKTNSADSLTSSPRPNRPTMLQPPQRPLTVGERLIPHITLETSVGNADKHVLRNVGKVEKFLTELLRKAVEDELVWPNFYTVALPDRD